MQIPSKVVPTSGEPELFESPVGARLQLAAIVDSSDDAIISKDLNGVITSWNTAATRLFGYAPSEIVGKSVLTIIPPDLQNEEPEILRKMKAGERIEHYETRRLRKDGESVYISLTISPIRDADGRVVGISKIARDMTDRRRAEAALIHSDRLAAIGRMAATVAHEVNNPLEAILNLAFLLERNESLDAEAQGYTKMLLAEVLRVSEITKQTLSFYRNSNKEEKHALNEVLEMVLKLHRPMIEEKGIALETRLPRDVYVCGKASELRQVFTNLIINAVDAMSRGGRLRVSTSTSADGKTAYAWLADSGTGVPVGVQGKIFEPFFSTKESKGTGLGLWVSANIMRQHKGAIKVRTSTTAGRSGTVMRLSFPVVD